MLLGVCIGLLIGLAQVILKEAWIKVEAGFRAGRELMLTKDETTIGRAEGCDLGLFGDNTIEKLHARIVLKNNRYLLEDAGDGGRDVRSTTSRSARAGAAAAPATGSGRQAACCASASEQKQEAAEPREPGGCRLERTRSTMPLVINCPHCKQQMQLADDAAGKQFRCPFCKNAFVAAGAGRRPPPRPPPPPAAGAAAGRRRRAAAGRRSRRPPPPPSRRPAPTACPACGAKLLEGAVACMDCGYLLQADSRPAEAGGAAQPLPQPGLRRRQPARRAQLPALQHAAADRRRARMLHGRYRREAPRDGRLRRGLPGRRHQGRQPRGRHQGHDLQRPAGVRHPPELLPPRGRDPAVAASSARSCRASTT